MTNQHQRQRRSLRLLIASVAAFLGALVALTILVERPTPPLDGDRPQASTSAIATTGTKPWGHDVLRSHDPAKPKAPPAVGPGLPAKTKLLATQQPFVTPATTSSPPMLPDAYRGAKPPLARRTQ